MNGENSVSSICAWIRSWGAARLNPWLADARQTLPPDVVLSLGNRGLLGLLAPARYGGLELDVPAAARVFAELGELDLSVATFVANHTLATLPVLWYANDFWRRQYLNDLSTGRRLAAFAMTEPGAGSNLTDVCAQAAPADSGWAISGEKRWIGTAGWADLITVFARHSDEQGVSALSAFLIPRDSPGVRITGESMTMGLRAMVQNSVTLDAVAVGRNQLLGEPFQGLEIAQACMTRNRVFLAAIAAGAMRRSLAKAREFASSRRISTGVLARNRYVELSLARHHQHAAKLEALAQRAALEAERQSDLAMPLACCAKLMAGEWLWSAVDFSLQLMGARGYEEDSGLARTLRDARAFRIFEGPSEALASYIGSLVYSGHGPIQGYVEGRADLAGQLKEARRRLSSCDPDVVRDIGYLRLGQLIAAGLAEAGPREMASILAELDNDIAEAQPQQCSGNKSTEVNFADKAPIHILFERAVEQYPGRTAIPSSSNPVTYRDLNRRANQLARILRTAGVGRGSIAGVALPRSAEAVVAMLAILKCSAAYLPIDPALPAQRASFMMAEAGVRIVVGSAMADGAIKVVPLPTSSTTDADDVNEGSGSLDDLAYVIFTSGSTGNPKGAMLPHDGPVNWLLWMREAFSCTAEDVVLWKAVVGFDHSVWECFLPLILGGKLAIAEEGKEADWDYLGELIESQQVTMAQFVPSVLGHFLGAVQGDQCRSLRHLMAGGEALPPALVRRFSEAIPNCKLCNAYGPTEASIGVTMYRCPEEIDTDYVPIGHPISNIRIHILDSDLKAVPPGERGELYIEGGLARGYINRPELTAERFIVSPFDSSKRLYKTGDIGLQLPDGNLRFIGRADHQVKIRGLRIELEEIEAVVRTHPAIAEAVCAVSGEGERAALWCYYRLRPGAPLAKRALEDYLGARLPAYMVPARLIKTEAFALTASGKIDRKGLAGLLAVPTAAAPGAETAELDLDTARREIVAVWRRILKVEDIGMNTDFYELGGNSLLITELLMFLRKQYGLRAGSDLRSIRTVSGILDRLAKESPAAAVARA